MARLCFQDAPEHVISIISLVMQETNLARYRKTTHVTAACRMLPGFRTHFTITKFLANLPTNGGIISLVMQETNLARYRKTTHVTAACRMLPGFRTHFTITKFLANLPANGGEGWPLNKKSLMPSPPD